MVSSKKNEPSATPGPDWAGRQITLAYEEHGQIIGNLQSELVEAKEREKALLAEFSVKFSTMQSVISDSAFKDVFTSNASFINSFCEEEEMPMDEMAEEIATSSRFEMQAVNKAKVEQRRQLKSLKEYQEKEMVDLRTKNQGRIDIIEGFLQDKVNDIEKLREESKRFELERNYYREMQIVNNQDRPNNASVASGTMLSLQSISPPNTPPSPPESAFESPPRSLYDSPPPGPPPSCFIDEELYTEINENDHNIRVDENFRERTDCHGLNQPISDTLRKLGNVAKSFILGQAEVDEKLEEGVLLEEENQFLSKIKDAYLSSKNKQETTISSLENDLQEALNQSREESDNVSKLRIQLETQKSRMSQMERELSVAKTSKNVFSDLEAKLRLVAVDSEIHTKEKNNLIKKYNLIEGQRDALIQEKGTYQKESEDSLQAFQRVMADVTGLKEEEAEQLNARIQYLMHENLELRKELNPSIDVGSLLLTLPLTSVVIENEKFEKLKYKAEKAEKLELELLQIKKEPIEAKSSGKENRNELEQCKEAIANLEKDLVNEKSELEEVQKIHQEQLTSLRKAKSTELVSQDKSHELEKVNEEIKSNNITFRKDIDLLKLNEANFENEIAGLKDYVEERDDLIAILLEDNEALQKPKEQFLSEIVSQEEKLKSLIEEKSLLETHLNESKVSTTSLEEEVARSSSEIDYLNDQVNKAHEVLRDAKSVHARENELESELYEMQLLLDKAMTSKSLLKKELRVKTEQINFSNSLNQKSLEKFGSENDHLENKLNMLRKEMKKLHDENNNLEQILKRSKIPIPEKCNGDSSYKLSLNNNQNIDILQKEDTHFTNVMKMQFNKQQEVHGKLKNSLKNNDLKNAQEIAETLNKGVDKIVAMINSNEAAEENAEIEIHDRRTRVRLLEETLRIQRKDNALLRGKIDNMTKDNDEELTTLNFEIARLKIQSSSNAIEVTEKKENLSCSNVLNGYISGDESDSEASLSNNNIVFEKSNDQIKILSEDNEAKERLQVLSKAKEKAENESKVNAESLTNAKLIISSLEQSNKTMAQDFKSRLQESNGAIGSLLENSGKYKKEASMLKVEMTRLKNSKENEIKNLNEIKKKYELLVKVDNLIEKKKIQNE